jgi:hypothetical protein
VNLPAVQFNLGDAYSQTFAIPISDGKSPDAHWYKFSALLTVPRGATGWQDFEIIGFYCGLISLVGASGTQESSFEYLKTG